jgi:hypothetical protein
VVPQVTVENSHCLNARQLTLFYRLLPNLCRIHAKAGPQSAAGKGHQTAPVTVLAHMFNILISMA